MATKPVSAIDAVFLDIEHPATPSVLAGFFIVDPSTAPAGFVRHRDILGYVEDRLHLAPALRKKLVFNPVKIEEPRLVDDDAFDLEFHVRHIALPSPHDARQLKILAARLFSRPMDLNRPLWEMYIIEGLSNLDIYPADSFAVLFKLHHTAFDGISAMTAIFSMLQRAVDERPSPPDTPWVRPPARRAFDWIWGSYAHAVSQVVGNLAALPTLTASAGKQASTLIKSVQEVAGKLKAPSTRFQTKVSSHRVFDWVRIPMARVKAVRVALGKPKVNDIAIGIVSGALRRYLAHHGELPDNSLLVACPVNIRGAGDASEGGNKITMMTLPMGTDIADPIERLAAIAAASSAKKAEVEQGSGLLLSALDYWPYAVRSLAVRGLVKLVGTGRLAPVANTVVTNVPNPPGDFFFAGAKMTTYAGLGPVYDQFGLFHTITSLEWELSISATSCREIMPDIALYMQFMTESFEELEAAALLRVAA